MRVAAGVGVSRCLIGGVGAAFLVTLMAAGSAMAGNTIPQLTLTPNPNTTEGALYTISGTFTDPDVGQTHTATVDWADGTVSNATINEGAQTLTATHVYADNDIIEGLVTLLDDAGGQDAKQFSCTISNVVPVVDAGPDQSASICVPLVISRPFHDAGTLDTHTATVDWGDGSPVTNASVIESPYGPPGNAAGLNGSIAASHAYSAIGPHTVTITVVDDNGGSDADSFAVTVSNGPDCNNNSVPDGCEILNYAVQCDGAGDYIRVPGNAAYAFGTGNFTVEMWIRPNVLAGDHRVLFCNEVLDNWQGALDSGGTSARLNFFAGQDGVVDLQSAALSWTLGQWYHIAYARTGSTLRIYRDGLQVASGIVTANVGNLTGLQFGYRRLPTASAHPWSGDLDEIRIWNIGRTESEIQSNRFRRLSGTESGMVGYWRADETGGQVVLDSSINLNHGTLGQSAAYENDDPQRVASGVPVASGDCDVNGVPDDCESFSDSDGDGVIDVCDNCPHIANTSQTDCNGNGIGDVCESGCWHTGDMNCNGATDLSDVTPFVNVLLNGGSNTQTQIADLNGDSFADGKDIDPLVDCLLGGPCGTGLSDGLPLNEHRVFVTSTRNNGNLGGIAGADAMCQSCAANAGLQRTYKAIISAAGDAAVDRLVISGPIWLWTCTGFEKVADDAADLWDGTIARALDRDELGVAIQTSLTAHTGSNVDGSAHVNNCNNWTTFAPGSEVTGFLSRTDAFWIFGSPSTGCNSQKRLYCISQQVLTWNLTSDFSHTINPNGAWSYGYYAWSGAPVDPNSFVLFPDVTAIGGTWTAGWQWYSSGIGIDPTVLRNEGAVAHGVPNGWTMLHPGPSDQGAVARWTAAIAGTAHVHGETLAGDTAAENLHVLKEGAELYSSGLTTSGVTFDLDIAIAVGERIDFVVEGNYASGSTPLSVTITLEE
jgi:hypothetical protein